MLNDAFDFHYLLLLIELSRTSNIKQNEIRLIIKEKCQLLCSKI